MFYEIYKYIFYVNILSNIYVICKNIIKSFIYRIVRNLVVVVQLLSRVQLFVNTWTAAHQISLSFIISWSLLKLMSIESVMPSNHLIPFHPLSFFLQSFPASGSFPLSWLFATGGQKIGASALASVPPVNIQDWFPLRLTGLILQSKGLSRVFSNTTDPSTNIIFSIPLNFLRPKQIANLCLKQVSVKINS